MLLSCAYDGKISCWRYDEDLKHGEIVKLNQELRCMGAVTENGQLLVGTNTFTILTQSITDWVNWGKMRDYMVAQQSDMGGRSDDDGRSFEEESKMDAIEYRAGGLREDDSDDILEGKSID